MKSLIPLLKASRAEDKIAGVLLSINYLDKLVSENESNFSSMKFDKVAYTILNSVGVDFVLKMLKYKGNGDKNVESLSLRHSALKLMGFACRYVECESLITCENIMQLVIVYFHETNESTKALCLSVIKFLYSSKSSDAKIRVMANILQNGNCTPNPTVALRMVVELIEIEDASNGYFESLFVFAEEKYLILLRSLFIQGLQATAPSDVRCETLQCLLDTLSLSMLWTLTKNDLTQIGQRKEAPMCGIFPVFLTTIISGEVHILLEEVLAICEDKSFAGKLPQYGTMLNVTLQLLVLILSALVVHIESNDSLFTSWAKLPAHALLVIKQHLDNAMKDSLDFLCETRRFLSASNSIATEAHWQRALLSTAEQVIKTLAAFALEDDRTLDSVLNNMPTLLWISSQSHSSSTVLFELVNCISQRCVDSESSQDSGHGDGKDEEALLFSMLDLDSQLLLHAASTVLLFVHAPDEVYSPPEQHHLQLVASCCTLLSLGCRHWTRQAKRMKVPLCAVLRTIQEVEVEAKPKDVMGIFDTLSALREALQKDALMDEMRLLNLELEHVWKQLRVTVT